MAAAAATPALAAPAGEVPTVGAYVAAADAVAASEDQQYQALFTQWKGSALIGGMGTQKLNRITFDGKGCPTPAERWAVGHRIRDVAPLR